MAKKGRRLSEEHKKKISEANKIALLGNRCHLGYKATPEQRKKMSESAKGNTSHLGFKCSKQSRKRMSDSAKAAWAR